MNLSSFSPFSVAKHIPSENQREREISDLTVDLQTKTNNWWLQSYEENCDRTSKKWNERVLYEMASMKLFLGLLFEYK